ncbi:MAG: hypothetical protein U9N72_05880 [Bacteroidota bacterium]|nr:hypothetical protein [Bacteroidota bacterium]
MKNIFLSISTLMIIISGLSAQDGESTLTSVGQEAPAFTCTTIDGKVIDPKEMKGKVI